MIRINKLRLFSSYLKVINNCSKFRPLTTTSSFSSNTENDEELSYYKKDRYNRSVSKQLLKVNDEKLSNFDLAINKCKNFEDILQFIETTNMRLSEEELLKTSSALFSLIKKAGSRISKKEILSSIGMQKFSKCIREQCRHVDIGDLITFLKILVYLEAPASDFTQQMVLKLISTQMNSLTLKNIIYIDFLLERMGEESKSPLSMAVHLALPMVFESQLELQIEDADTDTLVNLLSYAARFSLPEKSISIILDLLNKSTKSNIRPFSSHQALTVLWSLCDLKYYNNSQDLLLKKVYSTIIDNSAFIKNDYLSRALGRISKKFFIDNIPAFYNEDLLNTICHRFADPKADVDTLLHSISRISRMRHINIEYLDRIIEVLRSNPAHLINNEKIFVNTIRIFSMANYKPDKWKYLEPLFLQHPSSFSNSSREKEIGYQEVSLALDLLALELFPEELLQKIFSIDYLMKLDESATLSNILVLLSSTLKHLYPHSKDISPPPSLFQRWIDKLKRAQANSTYPYPIKSALEKGIGGENYVVSGIFNEGIFIDHAIVMRKGGYPIAININKSDDEDNDGDKNDPILFQNIEMPSESFAVLIKIFRKGAYAANTNRLRGIHALEVKVIERFGHPLLVIDLDKWEQLNDHEKIPFLMQKIREKSEQVSNDYYS